MTKYKCGAIVKDVPKGSEKWYKMAGWKKLETTKKKEEKDNESDSKEITTS